MLKYFIAATLFVTPTAANATTVEIDLDRMERITEAAHRICRTAIETKNAKGSDVIDRESAYLRLTQAETLYLYSLCILYTQGRIDAN